MASRKVAIFTYDLTPEKWHLMPWRTIVEVARYLPEYGFKVGVVSIGKERRSIEVPGFPEPIMEIPRERLDLGWALEQLRLGASIDVVFWPLTWRQPCSRLREVSRLGIPIIGYFPGGAYCWREAIYGAQRIGLRAALPYLLEAFTWKSQKVRCFGREGVKAIIALTEVTADTVQRAGWPADRVFCSYPGRDESRLDGRDFLGQLPSWAAEKIGSHPFLLYAGPPSAIRGIFELLDAFEFAADVDPHFRLVCLFRNDSALNVERIKRRISRLRHPDRVVAAWSSVSRDTLRAFYARSRAVVLPFLLVPSEIPLVFIELLEWHKPVITTAGGGTGEFAGRFGLRVDVGDVVGLAEAMLRLLGDDALYAQLAKRSAEVCDKHPSWKEMADSWKAAAVHASGQDWEVAS